MFCDHSYTFERGGINIIEEIYIYMSLANIGVLMMGKTRSILYIIITKVTLS